MTTYNVSVFRLTYPHIGASVSITHSKTRLAMKAPQQGNDRRCLPRPLTASILFPPGAIGCKITYHQFVMPLPHTIYHSLHLQSHYSIDLNIFFQPICHSLEQLYDPTDSFFFPQVSYLTVVCKYKASYNHLAIGLHEMTTLCISFVSLKWHIVSLLCTVIIFITRTTCTWLHCHRFIICWSLDSFLGSSLTNLLI